MKAHQTRQAPRSGTETSEGYICVPISKTELAKLLYISRVTLYKALRKNQITWQNGKPVYTPKPIGRPRKDGRR